MDKALDLLISRLPADTITLDHNQLAPRLQDWYGQYQGAAFALARPRLVSETSILLAWANEHRVPIVTQGGNTGLSGGAIPDMSGKSLLLSLERMNNIRSLSPNDNAIIVEAGCILAHIQEAATSVDRFFPLSLSTEGSCQIGGNLATNAGGINVLRYGMIRDLTLGLEVVRADGHILSDLRPLRKNNSGYDWKHLFIGSEGTLGIITAACLKLFPYPRIKATALVALCDLKLAPEIFHLCQDKMESQLISFELIPALGLELGGSKSPLSKQSEYYLLIEAAGQGDIPLASILEIALEKNWIKDAILAKNDKEAKALWLLREKMVEAQKRAHHILRHDIAVSIGKVPAFIEKAINLVHAYDSKILCLPFGHLGDGNIHFNLIVDRPDPMLHRKIEDLVIDMSGTFSAEHGIGKARLEEMQLYKSPEELRLMRDIKKILDPHQILNPGKVILLPDEKV